MTTSEPLQVLNLGIGGHFDLHWDQHIKRFECDDRFKNVCANGNRIATVQFYVSFQWFFLSSQLILKYFSQLSDVQVGGGTAFPFLKTFIPSVKGAAVFWHNLLHTGGDDFRTRHGSCPVVLGQRIVMNKWIHSYGQEFIKPCKVSDFEEQNEIKLYEEIF